MRRIWGSALIGSWTASPSLVLPSGATRVSVSGGGAFWNGGIIFRPLKCPWIFWLLFTLLVAASSHVPSLDPTTQRHNPLELETAEQRKVLSSIVSLEDGEIARLPWDSRKFRHLVLPNGLKVLLVQDERASMAYGSLSVLVGQLTAADPGGLAHLVEHLLLLATPTGSDEVSFDKYISTHSGRSNGFTRCESTNYHFQIPHRYLGEALDRFSQIFIMPSFTSEAVEREVTAIDAEFRATLRDEISRMNRIKSELSRIGHPYRQFGMGNAESLRGAGWSELSEALTHFYHMHYSAHVMALVVSGPAPLDDIQSIVVEKFSRIPHTTRPAAEGMANIQPLAEAHFKKLVRVEAIGSAQRLNLSWMLPGLSQYRSVTRPEGYYLYLLRQRGPGSIYEVLKERGWIHLLNVQAIVHRAEYSFLEIDLELTNQGVLNYQDIIRVVFQYFALLRQVGPQERIWSEMVFSEAQSHWQVMEPDLFVQQVAEDLHNCPPEWVVTGPAAVLKYDPDLVAMLSTHLTVETFRAILLAPDRLLGGDVQVERWYGIRYRVSGLNDLLADLQTVRPNPSLSLPTLNEFILDPGLVRYPCAPSRAAAVAVATDADTFAAARLRRLSGFKGHPQHRSLWHHPGRHRHIGALPLLHHYVGLFLESSPQPSACLKAHVMAQLFLQLLESALQEPLQRARAAGLTFQTTVLPHGIALLLGGPPQSLHLLLERVVRQARDLVVTDAQLAWNRDLVLVRFLRDLKNGFPFAGTTFTLDGVLLWGSYRFEQISKSLQGVTADEFNRLGKSFFISNSSDVFYHGDLAPSELTLLLDAIHGGSGPPTPQSDCPSAIKDKDLAKLGPSRKKIMRSNTSSTETAVRLYLQFADAHDPKIRALGRLFVDIVRDLFLDSLRHEKRLGYAMHIRYCEYLDTTGISLYIQGHSQTPKSLDAELETFLQRSLDFVRGISPEQFSLHQDSLLSELLAGPSSPLEEVQVQWAEITLRRYDFDRLAKEAASLKQIVQRDMCEFIRNYIVRAAPRRRAVSIHVSPRSRVNSQ
jgi:insulysin